MKKNIIKYYLLISLLSMVFSLGGCGSSQVNNSQENNTTPSQQQEVTTAQEGKSTASEEGTTAQDSEMEIELKDGEEVHVE